MKRLFYLALGLTPLLAFAGRAEKRPVPPLDAEPPAKTETATFALG